MGDWRGETDYFGGKVQQLASLGVEMDGKDKETARYSLHLRPMQTGRSHRFARFLGSRRVLQLNISDKYDVSYSHLRKWLAGHKFVLCGRVFVPFATKEGKVFMMETSEDYERYMSPSEGDHRRLTLQKFVEWHNPIRLNKHQASCRPCLHDCI